MGYKSSTLPDSVLRCMPKDARVPMGKAGVTSAEAQVKHDAVAEREVHKHISNWLRQHDIWFCHSRMDRKTTNQNGTPDFLFVATMPAWEGAQSLVKDRPIAIEVKVNGNELSEDQIRVRTQMVTNGWYYHVVSSLEELRTLVKP